MTSGYLISLTQQLAVLGGIKKIIGLFWGPDHRSCEEMMRDAFFQPLKDIESILDNDFSDAIRQVSTIIKNYPNAESLFDSLETSYVRLFISDRNGIIAPVYESCYEFQNAPLMGNAALRMQKLYVSRSLSVAGNIHEPPDHISIELEYLYFLIEKGWDTGDSALIDEAASFASKIMIPWVSKFQERLTAEKRCRFYPLIVSILISLLDLIGRFDRVNSQITG